MALRELLVEFTSKFNAEGIEKGHEATSALLDEVKELGEALLAAFAVEKVYEFTEGVINSVAALKLQADRLSISTDELQQWRYQAAQVGLEGDALDGIFRRLSASVTDTSTSADSATAIMKELGVQTKTSSGEYRSAAELFEDTGLALAGMSDRVKATGYAVRIFGRQGAQQILQMFKDGKPGIEKLNAEFESLGGGIREHFVEEADEARKSMLRLTQVWVTVQAQIAGLLLPALEAGVGAWTRTGQVLQVLARETNIVRAALLVLGGLGAATAVSLAAKYGEVILKFGAWAIVLALVALALDDIITFLEGGKSALDEYLDGIFGKDVAAEIRKWRDEFAALKEPFPALIEGLDSALTSMGASVDKFFLDWYGKWNNLVDTIGAPDALKIDTSAAESELKYFQDRQTALENKAFARENPDQAAAAKADDEKYRALQNGKAAAAIYTGGPGVRPPAAPAPFGPPEDPQALYRRLRREARARDSAATPSAAPPPETPGQDTRTGALPTGYAAAYSPVTAPIPASTVNSYTVDVKAPVQVTIQGTPNTAAIRETERAAKRGAEAGWRGAVASFEQSGRQP